MLVPLSGSSRQRAAVRARRREAGRLRGGGPADGHPDQEEHVRRDSVLDGARGHKAISLRLKGQKHELNIVVLHIPTSIWPHD